MPFQNVKIPEKYCESCGKRLQPKVYRSGSQECMTEFSQRKFCDRRCKGLAQRLPNGPKLGGLPHRGRKIARKAIKREICAMCGTTKRLEVHHIDGDATNNQLTNLQVLCLQCHRQVHKNTSCCVEGCERPYMGKGYCGLHYQRWRKYGDPLRLASGPVTS